MSDRPSARTYPQIVSDFGAFARRSTNLNHVLFEACRVVGEALGTGRASVLETQEGETELLLRASFGRLHDASDVLRLTIDDPLFKVFTANADEPMISSDVDSDDRFDTSTYLQAANVKAFATAPIVAADARAYGFIEVDSNEPREFAYDDIQFMRTVAIFVGMVVE